MPSQNSRSFFRIDVMLPCSYRVVSKEEALEEALPINPDSSYIEKHFMENLSELDEQIQTIINQIGTKSSVLAAALTVINTKINFVLETIDEKQLIQAIPQKMVNISAGGVAIKVTETLTLEDNIDLLIQPLADEAPILVRCNIVKIMPDKDLTNSSTLALEYQNMSEDDRRKLVYFIQSKEIEYANSQRKQQAD